MQLVVQCSTFTKSGMRSIIVLALLITISFGKLPAQIVAGSDTLYGNEWVDYDQSYVKFKVGEDGIYRISYDLLNSLGYAEVRGDELSLFYFGQVQRLYVSNDGLWGDGDYALFVGRKNRGELDSYLYESPDDMLNPGYSLVSDTSVYFLSLESTGSPRFEFIANESHENARQATWYQQTEELTPHVQHIKPRSGDVSFSHYVAGEGFGSGNGTTLEFDIPVSDAVEEVFQAKLQYRISGSNSLATVDLSWENEEIDAVPFDGTRMIVGELDLNEVNQARFVASTDHGYIRLGYLQLEYARSFSWYSQALWQLNLDNAAEGIVCQVSDVPGSNLWVIDLSTGKIVEATASTNQVDIHLPPGVEQRNLIIVDPETQIRDLDEATITSFDRLDQSNAQFMIISHPALRNASSGMDPVQEYADYRSSQAGGSYRTKIVDIHQLVDQFAYGVSLHPLSVKNFTNYIYHNWTDPQFLFLLGKGLRYPTARVRDESYEYLPAYGIPGSDNLLTSRLNNPVPLIPMGRLAVRNTGEISTYLEKIKVMEEQVATAPQTIEDRLWMNRAMHLSGGADGDESEKSFIFSSLQEMATSSYQGSIGASTRTVTKSSSDLSSGAVNDEHLNYINDGVFIKTYFGHGSSTGTQLDGFEKPFFLDNKDRYPIMLSLGCYTGDVYQRGVSLGESNIFAADKGAIGYLATSGLGSLSALDQVANYWYKEISNPSYGKAVGIVNRNTLKAFSDRGSNSIRRLSEQLVYHGDPAYIPHRDELPDYLVNTSSIRINPGYLHQELESYRVDFQLVNLGRNVGDTVTISLSHQSPAGKVIPLLDIRKRMGGAVDSVSLELAFPEGENIVGINKLLIEVDPQDDIEEVTSGGETNNQVIGSDGTPGINLVIYRTGIIPVFPQEFSIVTNEQIELVARTANPVGEPGNFELEIDTTALFNSPLKTSTVVQEQSGIIRWSPEIVTFSGKVYYWRAREANSNEEGWMSSSFTYSPQDQFGFDQSHYFQFLRNNLEGIIIDTVTRKNQFQESFANFELVIMARTGTDGLKGIVNNNSWSDFRRWGAVREGITFVLGDPTDTYGFVFNEFPGEYGSVNDRRTDPIAAFPFSTKTPESRQAIINFMENVIPDGTTVFAYTAQANPNLTLNVDEWEADSISFGGKNIFNVFESMGAGRIRQLKNGVRPYLFVFEKGNTTETSEQIAASPTDSVSLSYNIPRASNNGSIHSVEIGPANHWEELNSQIEKEVGDSATLEIYGLDGERNPTLLVSTRANQTLDLNSIDAEQYPYLTVSARFADSTNFTSPNLENWRVYYEGKPDLAIGFSGVDRSTCDTTRISPESISFNLPISNLSNFDWMDSTNIEVTMTDEANVSSRDTFTGPPVPAGQTIEIPVTLDMSGKTDNIQVVVEINPDGNQSEVYQDNNFMSLCYYIPSDKTNPVLNVFFEGKRIMDGELVSQNPEITIALKDENKHSLLTDSSVVSLYYIDPMGNRITPAESGEEVRFVPAADSANEAKVLFYPQLEVEGTYTLHVNATDNNENKAGESDYSVSFRISNEEAVGDVVPYPNPFTTSCRFLYTVHGSIVPDNFAIRIFSLSGRAVKTITREEIGPLRVGTNLTDYVWDGTDDYGDKLANGIYLYKVMTDSDHFEDRQLSSAFMEKGYGKITILR